MKKWFDTKKPNKVKCSDKNSDVFKNDKCSNKNIKDVKDYKNKALENVKDYKFSLKNNSVFVFFVFLLLSVKVPYFIINFHFFF